MIPGKSYTPEVILQIAWRRKWWILLPAIAVSVAVAAWTRTLTNLYRSETVILVVPQQVPEEYVKSTVTATVAERLEAISQQILSRTRLEKIIVDLNLYEFKRKTGIMEDIVDDMRSQITVQTVKGDAFRVAFINPDPRTAMRVTERLGSLFIDESLRDREVLAEGTNQFLEAQLEDARRLLIDNEKKLEEYRRTHYGELPTQLQANMQGLHNTEMQLQAELDNLNRERDQLDTLKRQIVDLEAGEMPQQPAPVVRQTETAADRLRVAEEQFAALQAKFKPDHPDVVRAKRVLQDFKKAAAEEAANAPVSESTALTPLERLRRSRLSEANRDVGVLEKNIAARLEQEQKLRANIAIYQKRIETAPARESELIELTRDYGTLQNSYQGLLAKKQASQISANLERRQIGEQFRVLDPARMPGRPFTPNRPRFYGLGVVGGIAFGLALAGLLEYLDHTMRSEIDVKVALNLPVLASVPMVIMSQGLSAARRAMLVLLALTATGLLGAGAFEALRYLR